MAYRKTEKVLAALEARRQNILASTMDVIAKGGLEALTSDSLRKRAGVPVGLIYHYFADLTEVVAAVVQQLLERDVAAVKECGSIVEAIPVFFHRVASNYGLMKVIGQMPAYRDAMKRELARLIRATDPAESPALLAAVVYGAILEAGGGAKTSKTEEALTAVLMAAVGIKRSARSYSE